jgi:asparagine synthase (glutamine-hydrolysing)
MPGITGVISARPAEECRRLVAAMVETMRHEPSYVTGMHETAELGIYAGWVAHGGSLAANQVFTNETGDIVLLWSGECFAPPETVCQLKRHGHICDERDGDWLVHLYEELDDRFFESLNGLFSGLLIDKRRRRGFLFNDRYGMERIYFCETQDALHFASEAKALLSVLPATRAFNRQGVTEFLRYGCTLDGRTLFEGVRLLPGGSLWTFQQGDCRKETYFKPAQWERLPGMTAQEFELSFRKTFLGILPHYCRADSSLGISLTGGLDTRMILACLPSAAKAPRCYTFAGATGETLDARLARRVARVVGLEHELLRLDTEFLTDFASHADKTVYASDGCSGVLGAHEVYLNQLARRISPVRLTGNFGSEVLRSMSTFKPRNLARELLSPEFRKAGEFVAEPSQQPAEHPVTFAAFKETPWSLAGSWLAARSQVTFRTPYLDNALVALAFQAPPDLRASPLSALRFVHACHPTLADIPTDRGLARDGRGSVNFLRHALAEWSFKLEYHTNEGLPNWLSPVDVLIQRFLSVLSMQGLHKYLHYRSWFRHELSAYLQDALSSVKVARGEFWDPEFLDGLASAHISGRANYLAEINAVLTLEAVERLLLRGDSWNQAQTVETLRPAPLQIA